MSDIDILNAYKNVGYSKSKVFGKLKKEGHKLTQKQVNDVLNKQDTEQLHKKQTKKIRGHITAFVVDEKHQIDLLDMSSYASKNKGMHWIMISVDVFTRRARAIPLKSKKSSDVLIGLKKIISESGQPVEYMMDSGPEWINKPVQNFLNEKKIVMNVNEVGNHQKLGIIDAFSKTIKNIIFKHFTTNKTTEWVDQLDRFIKIYNDNDHKGLPTDMTPNDVNENVKNETIVRQKNFEKATTETKHSIKVGAIVRIRIIKQFKKGFEETFTRDTFKVTKLYKVSAKLQNTYNDDVRKERIENLQEIPSDISVNPIPEVEKDEKNKKISDTIKHKEGIDIFKESYNKGDRIAIHIEDNEGKKEWYKATLSTKFKNGKFKVIWDNGDPTENILLSEEVVKKVR